MDRIREKQRWSKKRIAWLIVGVIGLGVVLIAFFFDLSIRSMSVQRSKIETAIIQKGEFQEFIQVRGNVLPIETLYLDSPEAGQVKEIFVEEGSFVEAGQALLLLENSELELVVRGHEERLNSEISLLDELELNFQQQLLEQKNEISKIAFTIASNERIYKRRAALWEEGLISELEYINSKATYEYSVESKSMMEELHQQSNALHQTRIDKQKLVIDRMTKDMELTRKRLDRLTLRSPVTGQLTSFEAELGESKSKGVRIGVVDVVDQLKVQATTDEHYLGRLVKGLSGTFELSGKSYELKIIKISPEIEEGVVEFDLSFGESTPRNLHMGQTLYIRLELGESESAVILPKGGFFQSTGGKWIFVVDEKGEIASRRDLSLGRHNNDMFEIIDGLTPGETVIISSYQTFKDAELLKLK